MTDAKPVPVTSTISRPYWDAAARDELRLPWCSGCAQWSFPPRGWCSGCGGRAFDWRAPSPTGEIVSFTVVHQAVDQSFRADVPYVVAVVGLDGGPRMITNLVDVDDVDAVAVGQRVELTFERRGDDVHLPQFRVVS